VQDRHCFFVAGEENMRVNQPNVSPWHAGELAVQERAGVGEVSGRGIRSSIPDGAAAFLSEQRLAIFGSVDDQNQTWASLRNGEPGFLRAVDPFTLQTGRMDLVGDPLVQNLKTRPDVGVLIIDFSTRRRLRINGEAEILPDGGLRIRAQQVYGNCQQYIQERVFEKHSQTGNSDVSLVCNGTKLSTDHRAWIQHADTLFIASAHPEYGVDASHRGGNPGFVRVEGPDVLVLPDYSGNKMFNTLGNIVVNPRVGLLFPDFARGQTLQLSGQAYVDWNRDRSSFPGAQRLLIFTVEKLIEMEQPALASYAFKGYSRFNPPVDENGVMDMRSGFLRTGAQ
jgi:uncharacterized protein